MAIGIKHTFPGITDYLLVIWFENTNRTAEVGRQVYPPGQSAGQAGGINVTSPAGLNADVYTFEFWQSTDGTTKNTLLDSWSVDASITGDIQKFDYVVDRGQSGTNPNWSDPNNGDTSLNDQRLKNADSLLVFSAGVGLRLSSDYNILTTGGISLNNGETFQSGDKWSILCIFKVQQQSPPVSGTTVYTDVNPVSINANFDSSYYGKNNLAAFTSKIGTTTFPAFALIPNRTKARFSTFGGSQRYWCLQFSGTDSVQFNGANKNRIWLGKNEIIELMFLNGTGYVLDYKGDYNRIGEVIDGRVLQPNCIFEDGTEYTFQEAGRFYDDFVSQLPSEQTVSYSQWGQPQTINYIVQTLNTLQTVIQTKTVYPYKGKYAIDTVNQKFKVPDRRGMGIRPLKIIDRTDPHYLLDVDRVTQGVGGYQADQAYVQHLDEGLDAHDGTGTGTGLGYTGGNPNTNQSKLKTKTYAGGNANSNTPAFNGLVPAMETRVEGYGILPMIGI